MIFKRKTYNQLLDWKEKDNGSTAILIKGSQGVGKSTIAEVFAKNEYKSYILIDFTKCSDEIKNIFNDISDLNYIFRKLQLEYGVTLEKRKSVIIFDEIQFCPKVRQAIKHLVNDGRYDYILIPSEESEISKFRMDYEESIWAMDDYAIPSEEYEISMFPMDYEEFRWAMDDYAIPILKQCFNEITPLGDDAKRRIHDFNLYRAFGGMPQNIAALIEELMFESGMRKKGYNKPL